MKTSKQLQGRRRTLTHVRKLRKDYNTVVMRKPVITIDGPAGAGKSTVAREVARQLRLLFLDTGAMYRAMTWKALDTDVDVRDAPALAAMVRATHLDMSHGRVLLDGRDITQEIRTEKVTESSRYIADPPEVRAELVRLQREIGRAGGLVTEGRDQGSVVFPDAEFRFYLDASIAERARRRHEEIGGDLEALRKAIAARDERDRGRPVGALTVPPGALVIDSSGLSIKQVVGRIMEALDGGDA